MDGTGRLTLDYSRPAELDGGGKGRRPVVVVGAGPVGLAAAIDCGLHGIPVLLLDEDDVVSAGSRAICWSKRTLEILDRLGVAAGMEARGITWNLGKVFHRDRLVYSFDLLPEDGHEHPAFINLQQYHVEAYLIERARTLPGVELRWRNRVVGIRPGAGGAVLEVETPDGRYEVAAEWVLAADGARSPVRRMLGLGFEGKVFEDRFLIADVRMTAAFPTERWFWFDPPFHPGQSALLHRQADGVWRIDLQLGRDADPEEERKPERVVPRLKAMLGDDAAFELDWVSVYTFQCRRLARFRHGRVVFVGDSAHQVSPFGARGGNSGIQDADNLVWKLALVLRGAAPETLIDSYDEERIPACDENILNSTRSTDFITPKGVGSRALRDAVLSLARSHDFARRLVNSGRLSLPASLGRSPLTTPDAEPRDGEPRDGEPRDGEPGDGEPWSGGARPGTPCPDAPMLDAAGEPAWLLDALGGRFLAMVFADGPGDLPVGAAAVLARHPVGCGMLVVLGDGAVLSTAPSIAAGVPVLVDRAGLARRRYGGGAGSVHLIRPDQHVAARWKRFDAHAVLAALDRAAGRGTVTAAKGAAAWTR